MYYYYSEKFNVISAYFERFCVWCFVVPYSFITFATATTPKTTAVGTTYNISTSDRYNIRIDGAAAGHQLGYNGASLGQKTFTDINRDGKLDLVIGAVFTDYGGQNDSGSVYIISGDILDDYAGTGNTLDLADTNNYSLRIDGDTTTGYLPTSGGVVFGDINNDGIDDMVISESFADSVRGNVFILYSSIYEGYLNSRGNVIDLSDTSNYNFKLQGASTGDSFGNLSLVLTDIDNDSKNDLIVEAHHDDNNSRGESGSIFVFFNTLLDDYTGTGNFLSMATLSNFSVRIDGALARHTFGGGATVVGDYNNDGKIDLFASSDLADYNSRNDSGSIWIIDNETIASLAGTSGNLIDMAISTNWVLRIDAATAGDLITYGNQLIVSDITNDGAVDLVVGTYQSDYNSRSNSGSVWILDNALFSGATGTGNTVDLGTSSNYLVRIDGAAASDNFSFVAMAVTDINNNGRNDLVVGAKLANGNGADSGSEYVFFDSLIDTWSTPGGTIDTSNTNNFSLRYDGAAGQKLFFQNGNFPDLNGDDQPDFIFNSRDAGYNSRTTSGSYFIIYNFPHTFSLSTELKTSDTSPILTGTIQAPNSTTTIESVEFSIDSNAPTGTWSSCSATSGSFDSSEESFTCTPGTLSEGAHTVYVRAIDEDGFYTAQPSYALVALTIDTTAPTASWLTPNGYTNNQQPILSAAKFSDQHAIQSYSVELDTGAYKQFGIADLPNTCGNVFECEYLHTQDFRIWYRNENDQDPSNDHISVVFKQLSNFPLLEGHHLWKFIGKDFANNYTVREAAVDVDVTSPNLVELTLPVIGAAQPGKTYTLAPQTTLALVGTVSDAKKGSEHTYADGSIQKFDAVASGADQVTFVIEKKGLGGVFTQWFEHSIEALTYTEDAIEKRTSFSTQLPKPLENGYYKMALAVARQSRE